MDIDIDKKVYTAIQSLLADGEKPSIRNIAKRINKINSLRSVDLAVKRLNEQWIILKGEENSISLKDFFEKSKVHTRRLPLIWEIKCWWFSYVEEIIDWEREVDEKLLRNSYDYFLLRAKWISMDLKWISEWDTLLIRKQVIANNGDIVVALINDEATLKEYRFENWVIKLIPHSSSSAYSTIIISEELIIQGVLEKNLGVL